MRIGERERVLSWYKGEGEKMGNTSVLLYVHLKNDLFPIFFPFPSYQGNTLSLANVVICPHCFLSAYKRL